eukprot:TRINITY_DN10761_c1_g1_i11.p1 TRINITY_DN10761_c1_g1~~TRINITY_DN10761_c1_g1_i11.p1  ORF type:complete len:253 (-),score=19.41 TRINITY_DN10761_c1_g1_i11:188-946(-)
MGTLCANALGPIHKTYSRSRRAILLQTNTFLRNGLPCESCYLPQFPPLTMQTKIQSCPQIVNVRCFHCTQVIKYREDYKMLGIPETATPEEIKRAYFQKAKDVHPDSSDAVDDTAFIELKTAYERLINESKFGTSSYNASDPRNDPRNQAYWDLRRRPQKSEEEKQRERRAENARRGMERKIMKRGIIGVIIGIFFGTIFPALFIGDGPQKELCNCEKCLLKRIRANPSTRFIVKEIKKKNEESIPTVTPST